MYRARLLLRTYASSSALRSTRPKRSLLTKGGLTLLGIGAAGYTVSETVRDDVDFAVHAVQRSSTVAIALSRCVYHYRRTLKATYSSEDERSEALRKCHKKCALITRTALERNAGVFIKLGQHLSALSYIFPEEWTKTMIPLQDQCPVSSFESVNELVQEDLGQPIFELFSEFEREPMGTASLAQVHHARLADGNEVAVKVQHPSLRRYVPLDVRLTESVFKLVDFFFPEYPLQWLSDEMRRSIFVELDFTSEARNAEATAEYFAKYYKETALRVPKVHWAKKRILCMEFVTGIRPDNRERLLEEGVDLKKLSLCFAHLFNNMIFTPNVGLHCDPHAGNIAIKPHTSNSQGFEVILYDHGLYRYVETPIREAYAHFWLALIDNDNDAMRFWAKQFAGITDDEFKLFSAAITGRDFDSAADGSVTKRPRSPEEIKKMQKALQKDSSLASQIMLMLHRMPPVVLLILKTNDLVRYLDEELGNPLGITKQFVIMAKYCAQTVYHENKDKATSKLGVFTAWAHYMWERLRLVVIQFIV